MLVNAVTAHHMFAFMSGHVAYNTEISL